MNISIETLLASPDETDRKHAIIRMAKESSEHYLEQIQKLADEDPSVDVRFFARRVLGFLRPRPDPEPGPEPGIDLDGLHRVFQSGTTLQKGRLVRALVEKNMREAVPALVEILSRAGGPGTAPLVEGEDAIISALLIAIGSLGGDRTLGTILPYLEHDSARVRANAIEALEWVRRGSEQPEATLLKAYPYLLGRLADRDNRVKANAARALSALDPQAVRRTLLMMLHANRAAMQASAAYVYRHLARDPDTRGLPGLAEVKALAKLLHGPNKSVRKLAISALEALGQRGIEAASQVLLAARSTPTDPGGESIEVLEEELAEERRSIELLKQELANANPGTRIRAIGAAVDRVGAVVGPILTEHAAREPDATVLSRILSALGQIRFRPGLELLRQCLSHTDGRCRANAVEAVARMEDEEVLRDLTPLLDDAHHRVRANAAVALKEALPREAMRTLQQLADSGDESHQRASVHALGQIGGAGIIPLLEPLARSESQEVAIRSRKLLARMEHQTLRESRTVRLFVSSTFRDMHAERDHLVSVTFPELRERLARLGLEFFDVDLRWGVPTQGADNERANSWAYCKRWIDRCQPLFLSILGQRYGWRPAASEITDTKDAQASPELVKDAVAFAGLSVTEMEIRHAVLSGRVDRGTVFCFRETRVPPDTPLAIHQEYVDLADVGRLEALKAEIERSGHPVINYHPVWSGDRFTGLEDFGRQVLESLWSGVLRDPRYVSREVWGRVIGKDPRQEPVYTDKSRPVPRELWERLVEEARPKPLDPLEAERRGMAEFAFDRLRWFSGREQEIVTLITFIESESAPLASRLLVVSAVPGQGKTALLAKLSQHTFSVPHVLISHFVGVTETSADPRALLDRLIKELIASGVMKQPEPARAGDFESLRKEFAEWAASYEGQRRVVLLIDAVNQMQGGMPSDWLPARLGAGLRVVVSCIDHPGLEPRSHEALVAAHLKAREPAPVIVPLPKLDPIDVLVIVIDYLREYCKELDEDPINAICAMEQARNPLYLMMMLNELRTLGGNDMHSLVPKMIAEMPVKRPTTVDLFDWVLERQEVFGAEEVKLWCSYLSLDLVSGMSGKVLADLLGAEFGGAGRSAARRIERGLRRYVAVRGEQLRFSSGQLREAVRRRYMKDEAAVKVRREEVGVWRWRAGRAIRLGELLLEGRWISPQQLQEALGSQIVTHRGLLETLMDLAFVDGDIFADVLSKQLDLPRIDVRRFDVDPALLSLLPLEYCRKNQVVPLGIDARDRLWVAIADPVNCLLIDDIESRTGMRVWPGLESIRRVGALIDWLQAQAHSMPSR